MVSRRHGVPGAMERNFSALLPIIVSGIDRTPQFLLTGSRSATKSVCGRENIDDYRHVDGHRRCPDAKLSSTQDITVRIGPSLLSFTLRRETTPQEPRQWTTKSMLGLSCVWLISAGKFHTRASLSRARANPRDERLSWNAVGQVV